MATPRVHAGLLEQLRKLIELPPNLISLDLRMAVDEIVTVRCTFHPEVVAFGERPPFTALYRLEEIPAEQTLPDDKASP